mmetsp:Transcript_19545/g.46386  ORF Transcript_19545/g.46386 Transcript_19545/m.46386 type:complete len:208 (+) Transcript_19545:2-625(+)
MRSSAGWSRMLLLCLAIGVTHTKVLQEGMELDDEQARKLPDMTDLTVMKTLKCGVCQASVMEMAYGINWAENRKGKKLTEIEKVEVMELMCATKVDKYGLVLDADGNPTAQWSNDDRVLRAKGGWVTRLAQGVCSDVYNDYEDFMLEAAPKSCTNDVEAGKRTCSTRDLVVEVCVKGFQWCGVEPEPDEKLPNAPQVVKEDEDKGEL